MDSKGTATLSWRGGFVLPLGVSLPAIPVASNQTLWEIAVFFTQAGAFVFGSGLAIIPFLYGGVVTEYGWLNDDQFLDAVAVAMITPGPVVITVAFIGFWSADLAGRRLQLWLHLFRAICLP